MARLKRVALRASTYAAIADRRTRLGLSARSVFAFGALSLALPFTTWLANAGYDPVYGARPLKRTIQKSLQDPLARRILEGRIRDGETVRVDAGDGGLLINGDVVPRAA